MYISSHTGWDSIAYPKTQTHTAVSAPSGVWWTRKTFYPVPGALCDCAAMHVPHLYNNPGVAFKLTHNKQVGRVTLLDAYHDLHLPASF